jgi:hypothetical protein
MIFSNMMDCAVRIRFFQSTLIDGNSTAGSVPIGFGDSIRGLKIIDDSAMPAPVGGIGGEPGGFTA